MINTTVSNLNEQKTKEIELPARTYLKKGELNRLDTTAIKDTFVLAELAYFNSKFNHALNLYKSIPPASPDCNDAFSRIQLIKENTPEDLVNYVNAELLYRKDKTEEALKVVKKLKQSHSNISLYASLLVLNALESKNNYDLMIKECKEFIAKFQETPKAPEVMMKMGNCYGKLGNKKEARRIYNEILLKYPKSPISPLARLELEK